MFKKFLMCLLAMPIAFLSINLAYSATATGTHSPGTYISGGPAGTHCEAQGNAGKTTTFVYTISSDRDTATGNNSDAINITAVRSDILDGNQVDTCTTASMENSTSDYPDMSAQIWSDDPGVTVSQSNHYIRTNYGGKTTTTATVRSSSSGTKTVSFGAIETGGVGFLKLFKSNIAYAASKFPYASIKLTFTGTQPSIVPIAPVITQAAPEKPNVASVEIKIANQIVAAADLVKQTVPENKPLVLSGTTVPNGIVHLYIHSEPIEVTTTADANGKWSYTIPTSIGTGEHTVQLAVTDPKTNKTSDKSDAIKFVLVAAAKSPAPSATVKKADYTWWYVGGASVLILVLCGVLGLLIWKRKRNPKKPSESPLQSLEQVRDQKSKE